MKAQNRTRRWWKYDRCRISCGDLTVWISPDLSWQTAEGLERRGRPPVFMDGAIRAVLTLRVPYQLPLRAAQDMAESLIRLNW
ncbi:transposase [Roseomonas sp. GCM10028921]